ncbi:MAG: alpha/beta family hydrolase [Thermoanaerobaculia bacterium]
MSDEKIDLLIDGPENAARSFVFAHGAGGAMDSSFMTRVAQGMAARGIRVIRFEFDYMAARRRGGKRGAPDRQPQLLDTWRRVVGEVGNASSLMIGGKSMGGRMATMVADELGVRGLICFGYPFHPPGDPNRLRVSHLEHLRTATLILQGTRDLFGTREQVSDYDLSPAIRLEWLEDGDHSFKPRRSSGVTEQQHVDQAIKLAAAFVESTE